MTFLQVVLNTTSKSTQLVAEEKIFLQLTKCFKIVITQVEDVTFSGENVRVGNLLHLYSLTLSRQKYSQKVTKLNIMTDGEASHLKSFKQLFLIVLIGTYQKQKWVKWPSTNVFFSNFFKGREEMNQNPEIWYLYIVRFVE